MVFSSLTFLYFFLPVVLLLYYITPKNLRNVVLLAANLVFYAWGEPRYLWIMVVTTLLNYACGLGIERFRDSKGMARLFLLGSVVGSFGFLAYFKYFGFFIETIQEAGLLRGFVAPQVLLPIGISFYIFQAMSYTVDVYRGDTRAQRNPLTFGAYISLFPQLIAGPIVRYKDVERQLIKRTETQEMFAHGVRLFVVGLAKKVLIANQMGVLWDTLLKTPGENGLLGAWAGILAYSFQIYFDFSGYSDMARGLGKLFGFDFMVNFNYPYISKSVTEFWRRWHISLSTWFRDYVYIPLGGNRKGALRTVGNLFIVWLLTGFWHGASYNFILWGLYYFFLLLMEKLFLGKWLKKAPAFLGHIYTIVAVMIGWVIFYFEKLPDLFHYLGGLFDVGNGLLGKDAGAALLSFLPLLLLAAAAATPLGAILNKRAEKQKWYSWVSPLLWTVGLLLCTVYLVSGTYNPFLYFRF